VAGGLAAIVSLGLMVPLAASGQPGHAQGREIEVDPGRNAITKALARADAGDKLHIQGGHYREAITIAEPVKLVGSRNGRVPVIDAGCQTEIAVAVRSAGVTLKRLKVVGATDGAIPGIGVDFRDVPTGRGQDLTVRDTCDAEYGINLLNTGPVSVTGSRTTGFSDAGIYVGDITDTGGGTLLVRGNDAYGNNKGAIVEFSAGGSIRLEDNDLHDNSLLGTGEPTGLLVFDSDGVQITDNRIRKNGGLGLHLTSNADANVLTRNVIAGNATDVLNEGSGNCGSGNVFATGGPLPPC
jgi:parallel beta-helix repeat protein